MKYNAMSNSLLHEHFVHKVISLYPPKTPQNWTEYRQRHAHYCQHEAPSDTALARVIRPRPRATVVPEEGTSKS